MNTPTKPKRPFIVSLLLFWQITELFGLLLFIPIFFMFSVMITGDSDKLFKTLMTYGLPSLLIFIVLKIIVLITMYKRKRWSLVFNLIQNLILSAIVIIFIIAMPYNAALYFWLLLYGSLVFACLYSFKLPYFNKIFM